MDKSRTSILIFINKAPIYWYSKQAPSFESNTFGAEFYAMRVAVDMMKALRYKLRMFSIPINGPASVFCNNEAVYMNTVIPESVLSKKMPSIAYHICRESVAAGIIQITKEGTKTNLADLFTKFLSRPQREKIVRKFHILRECLSISLPKD